MLRTRVSLLSLKGKEEILGEGLKAGPRQARAGLNEPGSDLLIFFEKKIPGHCLLHCLDLMALCLTHSILGGIELILGSNVSHCGIARYIVVK